MKYHVLPICEYRHFRAILKNYVENEFYQTLNAHNENIRKELSIDENKDSACIALGLPSHATENDINDRINELANIRMGLPAVPTQAELQNKIKELNYLDFGLSMDESIDKKIHLLFDNAKEFNDTATICGEREKETFLKLLKAEIKFDDPNNPSPEMEEKKKNYNYHKKTLRYVPPVYYLFDKDSMEKLHNILKPGDTIVLHAEGAPFLMGLDSKSPFDLDGVKLATLIKKANVVDGVNIELLSCNSAADYKTEDGYTFNFARDTSEALHYLFNYQHINVSGFRGYVVEKDNKKFSVCKTIDAENRGDNLSIDKAKITYLNGIKKHNAPQELDLSDKAFSWAQNYIHNAKIGKDEVRVARQKASEVSYTGSRFYKKTATANNASSNHINDENETTPGSPNIE